MPREQLLALAADVDRLLDAGATTAAGSDGLRRRSKALRELGRKVAALNPVADAIDELARSGGKHAGRAFLDLVAMTRQVRASLAVAGPDGDLKPATASGPWQTLLSVRDLDPVHEALTRRGSGREETIRDALTGGAVGDMRLLPALLAALGDGRASVADLVTDDVLPALGKAALPDLLSGLNFDAKAADLRRLTAICRIDRATGTDLCRRALREGNTTLRAWALRCLAMLVSPDEVEAIALDWVKEKKKDLRCAALTALHTSKSDAALDALVGVLTNSVWNEHGHGEALAGLKVLSHPGTAPRLLKEIDGKVAELLAGGTGRAKKKTDDENFRSLCQACAMIQAVGAREDDRRVEAVAALVPLARGEHRDVRRAALLALGEIGPVTEDVIPVLTGALADRSPEVVLAALEGLEEMTPADREPAVAAVLALARRKRIESKLRQKVVAFLAPYIATHPDEVEPLLRGLLRGHDLDNQECFAQAVVGAGTAVRRLLPDMLKLIKTSESLNHRFLESFTSVDPEGTEVVRSLLEMLRDGTAAANWLVFYILMEYNPSGKPAAPPLAALLEDGDPTIRHWAGIALRAINA
jgi:hypothetical protein